MLVNLGLLLMPSIVSLGKELVFRAPRRGLCLAMGVVLVTGYRTLGCRVLLSGEEHLYPEMRAIESPHLLQWNFGDFPQANFVHSMTGIYPSNPIQFSQLRPLWLVPFGIVFEGVSLAWFYLIQKERTMG